MYLFKRFNSRIIRRVHNRWHPESTVAETYHQYEWSHFLQSSAHLPNNSLLCPDSMEDLEENEMGGDEQLDSTQFSQLQLYYRCVVESYNAVCVRYEDDERKAKHRHQFGKFQPMSSWSPKSGPPLTSDEMAMCQNIQNSNS